MTVKVSDRVIGAALFVVFNRLLEALLNHLLHVRLDKRLYRKQGCTHDGCGGKETKAFPCVVAARVPSLQQEHRKEKQYKWSGQGRTNIHETTTLRPGPGAVVTSSYSRDMPRIC